jgi:hypothetical protein
MRPQRTNAWLLALGLSVNVAWVARAADTPASTPPVQTEERALPPLPPPVLVVTFRQLLEMDAPARERTLAELSPKRQEFLRAKLREYEGLTPEQREARLRLTELYTHLAPLMRLEPGARAAQLAEVPASLRPLIEERLRLWDGLPADLRADILANQEVMYYFVRLDSTTPAQQQAMLDILSPAQRQRLEEGLAHWRTMSPERRTETYRAFQAFLSADTAERRRTLDALSPAGRQQLQQTLRAWQDLSAAQRAQYLESFRKFVDLTPAEREQFLRNVERWRTMSPEARTAWRRLVSRLPPIPPPPPPTPRRNAGVPAGALSRMTNTSQ